MQALYQAELHSVYTKQILLSHPKCKQKILDFYAIRYNIPPNKFIILNQYIMNQSELLERARHCFSKKYDGKTPEELGYKEAVEFSYKALSNKVTGVVFAPSKEIANAFIENQTILWKVARVFLISTFLFIFYMFGFLATVSNGANLLAYTVPGIVVLLIVMFVLLILGIKCNKNEKLFKNKIVTFIN